ncbi:hypothetical protein ElyMa_004525200 [Elysia marginata]|uniref:Uncharacterized protein n=1 Tax=Elysia marginata TaxID=1093978 RepID=A0AAV4HM81_9GAST|nr:hypothetical protein ElyMa_004525200 [Elysia marginata]
MMASDVERIATIKYYLDEIERGTVSSFTNPSYEANVPHALSTLVDLHTNLSASSSDFRHKVLKICQRGSISLPNLLYTFFTKHMFLSPIEFQEAYPVTSSMLALVLRR